MCFDNKVNYLTYVIRNIGRLPDENEFFFEDNEDLRVFFDKLAFINAINNEKLELKPALKIGYNLILETLDEYKLDLPESIKDLIVQIFKEKLELNKKLDNKDYKDIKEIKKLESNIKKDEIKLMDITKKKKAKIKK